MTRLIVANHLTLDGVLQSPAAADEDTRDGFAQGGWARAHQDPAVDAALRANLSGVGAYLFGRRTYEHLAGVWGQRTDGNAFTTAFESTPKYVVTRTLAEPLSWTKSIRLDGDDPMPAVAELRRGGVPQDRDIVVFGSGELVHGLTAHGLVDRFVLMIHPVVLGAGRRMFAPGFASTTLRLVDATCAPSGVVVATYDTLSPRN